jgi:uncharacterized protein (UPF0210 family)
MSDEMSEEMFDLVRLSLMCKHDFYEGELVEHSNVIKGLKKVGNSLRVRVNVTISNLPQKAWSNADWSLIKSLMLEIKATDDQICESELASITTNAELDVVEAMMDARAAELVRRNNNTEETAAAAVAAIDLLWEADKAVVAAKAAEKEAAGF